MNEEMITLLTALYLSRMRLPAELRADQEEQQRMREYITAGERYLNEIACSQAVDYINDHTARDLLYNYCFYARADSTEKFEPAYRHSLLQFRLLAQAGKLGVIA